MDHLLRQDPVFSQHLFDLDEFQWEKFSPGFEGMVRIVVGQQVSTAAARTIWSRIERGLASVTPGSVLKAGEDDLRGFGLSRQKIACIKNLATSVEKGDFDPAAMKKLANEDVVLTITALKGFGPWSAQMFLMFALARPDIWAPADLGIQGGMRYYLNLQSRPGQDVMAAAGDRFYPHQTAACLLLWHINGRGGLP